MKMAVFVAPQRIRLALVVLILAALLAGCARVGPRTVVRDRFDYVSAISESWKRQTLLNLLKTRYLDAPVFLDVASVISQYSLEQEVGLGVSGEFYNKGEPSFISPEITARGTYADRPTITYNPLMGEKFTRSLLKPFPTTAILLLVQNGYPIDQVLLVCAQGINGLYNRSNSITSRLADPEFYEVLTLLRQIQKVNGMRMRSSVIDNRETITIFFKEPRTGGGVLKLKRVLHLLGLNPNARKFRVVHGLLSENDREIAILSRSMMHARRIGQETVQYVRNIYIYYTAYRLTFNELQVKRKVKEKELTT
jgi:hypothetical protein